jgi:hypothetical protein
MPRLTTATVLIAALASAAAAQPVPTPAAPSAAPPAAAPSVPAGPGGLTTEGPGFNSPPPKASCAPEQLFRAVVRNVSPGLAAADRRAQPRTIFRKGLAYFRADDAPDLARGDQNTVIIAEPDIWEVNVAKRQALHRTDPGPSLDVHAPVLPLMPGMPPLFMTLEYGCEAAFVAANAPTPQGQVAWGSTPAALHVLTQAEHNLAILMDDRHQEPLMISYVRAGKPVFVMRYDDYRQGVPEREGLFAPPKWAEAAPDKAGPPTGAAPDESLRAPPKRGGRPARPHGKRKGVRATS